MQTGITGDYTSVSFTPEQELWAKCCSMMPRVVGRRRARHRAAGGESALRVARRRREPLRPRIVFGPFSRLTTGRADAGRVLCDGRGRSRDLSPQVTSRTARRGAGELPLPFAAVSSEGAESPTFSLDVTADGDGWTTVSVAGELDLATADEFAAAVRTGLATGAVVVDLREVTFMDSAGVRALNTVARESADSGRELRLFLGTHPGVVQVLEMTGMLELLPVEDCR
jgi:anti-sigma B factor antagonist